MLCTLVHIYFISLPLFFHPTQAFEHTKVKSELAQTLQSGQSQTVIVNYKPNKETKAILQNLLNSEKSNYVFVNHLNKVVVAKTNVKVLNMLVDLPGVVSIDSDTLVSPESNIFETTMDNIEFIKPTLQSTNKLSWNFDLINARCDSITCFGDNVVVGIIDTGVQVNHSELQHNWYGFPYGWFDGFKFAFPDGTEPSPFPTDSFGSGTAALSTAVGKTVGIAPNAKWIACKGCRDDGICSRAAFLICAQFMLCPWDTTNPPPNETPKKCKFRPDIVMIHNWGTNFAQLLDPDNFWLYDLLQAWNNVGILSFSPIGDTGPDCNSGSIPAVYDNMFAVGSVDKHITVSDFSSRGPSFLRQPISKHSLSSGTCPADIHDYPECTGESKKNYSSPCVFTKPDITAPGDLVPVAYIDPENPIVLTQGTAYATGHVAGVAALMICATEYKVKWDYHKAYKVLTETAQRSKSKLLESGSNAQVFSDSSHLLCDVIIGKACHSFPSNVCGWGLVNACEAVKTANMLEY